MDAVWTAYFSFPFNGRPIYLVMVSHLLNIIYFNESHNSFVPSVTRGISRHWLVDLEEEKKIDGTRFIGLISLTY